MKKAIKTCMCTIAGLCILVGVGFISNAQELNLPEAGATSDLDTYVTSTAVSALPGAGVSLTLSNYYSTHPDASADAQVVEYLVPSVKSEYADIAIAQVSNYVNIRNASNENGEILGKLYNESAATVVGEEGDWYQITSGTVTGFVKKEFVVTGEQAATLAEQVGTKIATVTTETLKVREAASVDSSVLTLVPADEELTVVEQVEGWTKVSLDADVVGYVSNDYITVRTDFVQAESVEEEKARLAAEAEAKRKAEEAARKADEAAKKAAAEKAAKAEAAKQAAAAQAAAEAAAAQQQAEAQTTETQPATSVAASGTRQGIVSYALQFVGNPYVAGGTSLTKGADCSGFVQSVFRDCGYSLPRSSRQQAGSGREVSLDQIQPGDLLFYSSGKSINHVAIYIGNGQVVHASTRRTGIKISNYNYRTPCKAVSYVD